MAAGAKGRVGIIGLGIMGGAFARNLIADGWVVAGVDTDPQRRKQMTKAGVPVSDNVKELIAEVPVVITSLPKPEALIATAKAIAAAGLPPRIIAAVRR